MIYFFSSTRRRPPCLRQRRTRHPRRMLLRKARPLNQPLPKRPRRSRPKRNDLWPHASVKTEAAALSAKPPRKSERAKSPWLANSHCTGHRFRTRPADAQGRPDSSEGIEACCSIRLGARRPPESGPQRRGDPCAPNQDLARGILHILAVGPLYGSASVLVRVPGRASGQPSGSETNRRLDPQASFPHNARDVSGTLQ